MTDPLAFLSPEARAALVELVREVVEDVLADPEQHRRRPELLTDRGRLIEGVPERLARLGHTATIQLLSADTFGTLAEIAAVLSLDPRRIEDGEDKRRIVKELGPSACAAVGNGLNDVPMLEAAELAIAVAGPEGASAGALAAADVVCCSIIEALDLLLDARALVATLRP